MSTEPEDERLAAVGRLYDRLAPSLFRYAVMLLANVRDAEDVVHRVFIRLIKRGVDDITSDGYARRAVRNECLNLYADFAAAGRHILTDDTGDAATIASRIRAGVEKGESRLA